MHRRVGRLLRRSVIALLVLLALLLSALRLGVGQVTEYRQQAESLLSDYLGQPVSIAGMDARMIGFSPSLVLEQFALLETHHGQPLAEFDHLALALDLPATLWQLKPVLRVLLSGADIALQRQQDGRIAIKGLSHRPATSTDNDGHTLLQWLFSMPRLSIQNSRLLWQDQLTNEHWQFEQLLLTLENQPGLHRFKGSVALPEQMGQRVELAAELTGDPLLPSSWTLDFFVRLQGLHTTARAKRYQYADWQLQQGMLDLELWGKWQHERLIQLQGELQLHDLQLHSKIQGTHRFPYLGTRLHYQHTENTRALHLDRLRLDQVTAPMRLSLSQQDEHWQLQGTHLQLEALQPLLPMLPLNEEQHEMLHALSPRGRIDDLYLSLASGQLQAASARLENLNLQASQQLPGVEGLFARLDYQDERLRLQLDSPALRGHWPRLFSRPLHLSNSRGDFQLEQEDSGHWRLFGRELRIDNTDIQLQTTLQVLFDEQSTPLISLRGTFQQATATAVPHYLPDQIMPEGAVRWLQQAFLTGMANAGSLSLHGRLGDFPFRQGQGRFEVLLDAADVDLNYAPDWPLLKTVSGQVHFDGPGLQIQGYHGQIFDAHIGATQIRLSDFRHPMLLIEGSASAGAADGLRFLLQSPLGNQLTALQRFEAHGDTRVELDLALPLAERLRNTGHIRGRIHFHDSQLAVHEDVQLEQINGVLHFNDQRFHARGIEAQLYQQPLQVDVVHRAGTQQETLLIAHGKLDPSSLQSHWQQPWLKQLSGQSLWQGQLHIPHQGDGHPWLYLSSPTTGLASTLPHPLTKTSAEYLPVELMLNLGKGETKGHTLRLGKRLATRAKPAADGRLQRASLHFGDNTFPELPEDNSLMFTGRLQGLQPSDWLGLLPENHAMGPSTLPIRIHMQQLHLLGAADTAPSPSTDAAWLLHRTISIAIDDVRYQDMTLGKVTMQLVPKAGQLQIENLQLDSDAFAMQGSGSWQPRRGTALSLSLQSEDTGKMLSELSFVSVIRKGKLKSTASLNWPASPIAASLATLQGDIKLRIDDGVIDEARPGAGKLFGILSLQALPRRLFLDFRDIADDGLHFNKLRAELKLADGNAHTSEIIIDSHPAQILISGRTGLLARDFEQEMVVIPQVSDTVTVAGALTMGPQIGAMLLVLQRLFKRDIDAATMRHYRITGSWEKPDIVWLNPPSENKATEDATPW